MLIVCLLIFAPVCVIFEVGLKEENNFFNIVYAPVKYPNQF